MAISGAISVALLIAALSIGPSNGKMDIAGLSLTSGLTQEEKNALLKEHNFLRSLQAQGKVPNQPAAADMTRLEWSDSTARHAQVWADQCRENHGSYKEFGDGQNLALDGGRDIIFNRVFQQWFWKEYPLYSYGSSFGGGVGHYTQIVTAYSHKLGCGANKCPGRRFAHLICNFHVGGNMYGKPPFQIGPACSKCPAGFGFCKDSLCTSSRACSASDPSCVCKVNPTTCAKNGVFDSSKCECKCKDGYAGLNCEKTCEDDPFKGCARKKNDGSCQPSASNIYYTDTVLNCRASCGFCKAAKSKPIRVRTFIPSGVPNKFNWKIRNGNGGRKVWTSFQPYSNSQSLKNFGSDGNSNWVTVGTGNSAFLPNGWDY